MDRQFLHHYNQELQHLRQTAGEFAREYPKIASRLSLDPDGKEACPDPFVERLIEGFAYLAARVQVKLDAEFPRFTQSLLETVYPDYLSPTPSMAVIRFEPDLKNKALAGGFSIPRGTPIRSGASKSTQTRCTYRTAHDLTLWPITLREAHYRDRSLSTLELPPSSRAAAAVHMIFDAEAELSFADIPLDTLTFFLRGTDSLPVKVMEHLFAHGLGAWVRDPADPATGWQQLEAGCLSPVGFAKTESLLPDNPATFEGYRLLMEYFAFPQRFLFFRVAGLDRVRRPMSGSAFELAFVLDQADPTLAALINKSLFDICSTPAINLFEKRTDRIPVSNRAPEFHVVVDRTRPIDFEVHSVRAVTAYGKSGTEQPFRPFYAVKDKDGENATAFFTVHRKRRTATEKERQFGSLSSYQGSEVYLSFVDSASAPYCGDIEQFGVTALCTNRHLPLRLRQSDRGTEFAVEMNGPVKSAGCLAGPTAPRPSVAIGETAWRLINHLSLNYLSLNDSSETEGAAALRELLRLYVGPEDRTLQKQVDGVISMAATPVLRRVTAQGMISFARGLEVKIILDEDAFTGFGIFIFGMVLEEFFARHVAINSFTETVIVSKQRGEIIRWPARTGRKPIL